MLRKSEVKSATGIPECRRKKSTMPDNLSRGRKQKSEFSKSTTNTADKRSTTKNKGSKDTRLTTNLPDDAAIHFGNFYGVEKNLNKPRAGRVRSLLDSTSPSSTNYKPTPRVEFTRQMVHKFASNELYELLKEKLDDAESGKARDIFKEDSSERSSLEEWSEDEQVEDGGNFQDDGPMNFLTREKSSLNLLSDGSSSVTEAKDTDSKESNDDRKEKKLNE